MKQFIVAIPKSKVGPFATYAFQNEIRTIISWTEESGFFSLGDETKIHTVCIAAEDKTTALMASEWKQFVKP